MKTTLRDILDLNFADSNSESGYQDNLLFQLNYVDGSDSVESTNYFFEENEMILIDQSISFNLNESVKVEPQNRLAVVFDNGDELRIMRLQYVQLKEIR